MSAVRVAVACLSAILFVLVSACAEGEQESRMASRKLSREFRDGATVWPRIHDLLETGPKSRRDIATALDMPLGNLAPALTKMKAQGVIRQAARGSWEAVPRAEWPADRGKMSRTRSGPESHSWNGGRYTNSEGYVLVNVGRGHPMSDVRGYVYEHRLVGALMLGRLLRSDEQVHHRDEDRQNNDPFNLEVLTLPEHKVEHRVVGLDRQLPGEENPTVSCACGCGGTFQKFDRWKRPRRILPGHRRAVTQQSEAA